VDEIKSVVCIYDASLGQKSNETSGIAIQARQRESDTATFTYIDNLSRAIRLLGKILIDLIPRIYDSERIVRVLGVDGSEKLTPVNRRIGDIVLHDLTVGKYDVTVSVGPSYATQRIEAANSMIQFMQAYPQGAPFIADLLAGSMDWPKSEEVAERLNMLLPPQVRAAGNPEAMAQLQQQQAMQAQQPNPQVQAEQIQSQARVAAAQATIKKAELDLQGKEMELHGKAADAARKIVALRPQQPQAMPGMPGQAMPSPVGQFTG
jgi:hypothetical protein